MRGPLTALHPANALTYASMAAAVGATAAAASGGPDAAGVAGALLAAAAIADAFDGRFARRFARTPPQAAAGRELDSLADVLVFGLTPVVVASRLPGPPVAGPAAWLWWAAAFVYVVAAATRLAHFNVADDDARFAGVPTPAIALVWSTALLLPLTPAVAGALFVACAALMVVPISLPRPGLRGLIVFAGWAVSVMVMHGTGV